MNETRLITMMPQPNYIDVVVGVINNNNNNVYLRTIQNTKYNN